MAKQRYLVVVERPPSEVAPSSPDRRPSLLLPFSPEGTVSTFVEELWRRLSRHNQSIPLTPDSHHVALHLGDATGPTIDTEDVLSDVVLDAHREKIYAVFSRKDDDMTAKRVEQNTASGSSKVTDDDGARLSFRVITPSSARNRVCCPVLELPVSSTVGELHSNIAKTLAFTSTTEEDVDTYECNCKLAADVARGPSVPTQFMVVHSNSVVERLALAIATETGLRETLSEKFGHELETMKKVSLFGAESDRSNSDNYVKTPIVSICSKQRHVPKNTHPDFDTDSDETGKKKSEVLDLHTSELPIHPACFHFTIKELGLRALEVDGAVDIFVTPRFTVGRLPILRGKSAIFSSRAHWEPASQSDRGLAMFLSTLRVFASRVQDMEDDERMQDAVLHAFDLLTQFPPALRCLHILIQGRTPTAPECAAISQATFAALNDYLALDIIENDSSRSFEGSRLFFGYILETARSLNKLAGERSTDAEESEQQNESAFLTVDLRDHKTMEPVCHARQTSHGLMEASLFRSLQEREVLAESHLQSFPVELDIDPRLARVALQTGGTCAVVTVLSMAGMKDLGNRFTKASGAHFALDLDQLSDLGLLADLCGRNNLAVHRPSQLSSAVAPCLAFDRNAHLAVYTGEMPCGEPGKSSIIFRPQHGEETIDPTILEQLIDPIVKGYEKDGSSVFDSFVGATVRWLQDPDEILVFCVDTSQSMVSPTDFEKVILPGNPSLDSQVAELVGDDTHGRLSLDNTEKRIAKHESFNDMIAIIAATSEENRDAVMRKVLRYFVMVLSSEILQKSEALGELRQSAPLRLLPRSQAVLDQESDLESLQIFWAGIKTHEESLCHFLRRRAICVDERSARNWTWSLGDPIPAEPSSQGFASLGPKIAYLPDWMRCPISHQLMEDAVTAADGHTYSRSAISRWFTIKRLSPLHGTPLDDISLTVDAETRELVESWVTSGLVTDRSDVITVTFTSRIGSFSRTISRRARPKDLYRIAYRGLMAKYEAFQLCTSDARTLAPTSTMDMSLIGLQDGDRITIRLPEDTDVLHTVSRNGSGNSPTGMCLVKVYSNSTDFELFRYWAKRDSPETMNTIVWKYWRLVMDGATMIEYEERDKLAAYLNRHDLYGRLEQENVFNKQHLGPSAATPGSDSRYRVLKVMIIDHEDETKKEHDKLTRLDVLKQMFEALVNRMLDFNYKTHVGLVSFSSTPRLDMPITHVLENFRRATNELTADGDTALWDALALASDQIEQYAHKYPDAKKRGVAVDSVCLGVEDYEELSTLSYLLGSYCFYPMTLANALAICEMEPFLSLTQRPTITFPLPQNKYSREFSTRFAAARHRSSRTVVTDDRVPPIKKHPNLDDDFVQLRSVAAQRNARVHGGESSTGSTGSKLRIPRLINEMKSLVANAHPKYDIYVSTTDISFWKVVMQGPDESPYSDGTFLLYLHAETKYPAFAPKARFLTKVKHPNINAHGRICHSIFDRDWTSDTSMTTVLNCVYGLLFQPEFSDPVNTTTILGFHLDQAAFAEEVREHVRKHASRDRGQWKFLLTGDLSV